jgi:hypothetical protein
VVFASAAAKEPIVSCKDGSRSLVFEEVATNEFRLKVEEANSRGNFMNVFLNNVPDDLPKQLDITLSRGAAASPPRCFIEDSPILIECSQYGLDNTKITDNKSGKTSVYPTHSPRFANKFIESELVNKAGDLEKENYYDFYLMAQRQDPSTLPVNQGTRVLFTSVMRFRENTCVGRK